MVASLTLPKCPEPLRGERLKDKVVVITGGAQGIGEAIVACFQAQQAKVVIGDIQGDKVEQVAAGWRERGGDVLALKTDVTQPQELNALIELAVTRHGRIDVLVNCAGVNVFRDPLEMTEEDWRRCFAIDLDGVWYGCKAALPYMLERGVGNIINIASVQADLARPTIAPYTASKGGIRNLTRAMTAEWAAEGLQINAIAPGYIHTEMTQNLVDDEAFNSWILGRTPARRWGSVEDIVGPAIWLASDASNFVNGQVVFIDGGMTTVV